MEKDVAKYHKALKGEDKLIAEKLHQEISKALPKADNKVWHAHPVWFLDGNPIVGYSRLKDCVRLLFWSGQSFKTPGLHKEGSFKAAEARYESLSDIKVTSLRRWLKESKTIQWDYKNLIKMKGVLKRIK